MSVGEWQRIALARTLWRDAWLVILDEPTSAMDAEAEGRFWEGLRPSLEGRAALLISHRFSTVRQADRIYVLEGGRVAEEGRHEDLVARGGTYARLRHPGRGSTTESPACSGALPTGRRAREYCGSLVALQDRAPRDDNRAQARGELRMRAPVSWRRSRLLGDD